MVWGDDIKRLEKRIESLSEAVLYLLVQVQEDKQAIHEGYLQPVGIRRNQSAITALLRAEIELREVEKHISRLR